MTGEIIMKLLYAMLPYIMKVNIFTKMLLTYSGVGHRG